ncbi:LAFA_0D08526g1_1 [Lachancea sp. 'fantastica']|nr:LAFA_0D08526g1_1 [Lachancea sp. 'fantastica']
MASVRKRKMARSSIKKTSRKNKDRHRKINISGNPIIAKNWDYSLTLSQNYEKLGLRAKLQTPAGGQEAKLGASVMKEPLSTPSFLEYDDDEFGPEESASTEQNLTLEPEEEEIPEGEARIVRDSEGNVVKVIYGTKQSDVGSDDIDEAEDPATKTETIKELEAYASRPAIKRARKPSGREEAWLKALYEKHGDDFRAMFLDRKLNLNQQSEGDIKKRIIKWRAANEVA